MSDLSQGGVRFLSLAAAFASDTRLYQLETPLGQDILLVERFIGKEELSALYEYHVTCLSTDPHLELKSLLGQQAILRTRLAHGTHAARSGYVSSIAQLGADGGLARYRLTLAPWLALAQHQHRSRVFQDASVLTIVEQVLAAYAPRNHWRAAPEVDAFLARARPRSYCCQYRESDYAFLTRLTVENLKMAIKRFRIDSFPDAVMFCTTALSTSERFYAHPVFQEVLEAGNWTPGQLGQAFADISDKSWAEIQAM